MKEFLSDLAPMYLIGSDKSWRKILKRVNNITECAGVVSLAWSSVCKSFIIIYIIKRKFLLEAAFWLPPLILAHFRTYKTTFWASGVAVIL